jgi:hypothetical protein
MERRQATSSERRDREDIDRPHGIRLIKHRDSYRLSCLAWYPNGEIVDMSLSIDDGQISTKPAETVLPASHRHFY